VTNPAELDAFSDFGDEVPWLSGQSGDAAAGTFGPVDLPRIEAAVREILAAIGEDPTRDGLLDTPSRVARMYAEVFAGLREEPDQHLQVMFEAEHDEMVMVRDISLTSMCEHHLVPFIGKAHVAYIPN
jgi:GTP cyclohydrolase IA